jgi:outer membrane autotransporter protein
VVGSLEDLEANGNFYSLGGNAGSITLGADRQMAETLRLGFLAQWATGELDHRSLSTESTSFSLGAYASYGAPTGFFLDGLLSFGLHDVETTRRFAGVTLGQGDSAATGWTAMLGGGYRIQSGWVAWGPVAGLEWASVDFDRYAETGPLALAIPDRTADSLRSLLGVRVESALSGWEGARIFAMVRWAHEFEDTGSGRVTTGLVGLPGSFTTSALADRAEDTILLNAGASMALPGDSTLGIGYFGDVPFDDGLASHGAMVEWNMSF